jgi:hypothetical protein
VFENSNAFAYQPPSFQASGYSQLNERVTFLERQLRQLVQEKRLRLELEDNFRKNQIKVQNKQLEVVRGTNVNINDYLKRSKEQVDFRRKFTLPLPRKPACFVC